MPQPGQAQFLPECGYNFKEQWSRAFELDPKCVFITGWNEWIMGRWTTFGRYEYPGIFVDQFTQEFSRDIEPMRGGHADDYYYQMIDAIRRFKGIEKAEPALCRHTVDIDDFSGWERVPHVYLDDIGDNLPRQHRGFGAAGPYVIPKGRNDFELCKVCHDDTFVYFLVQTHEAIQPYLCDMGAWMQLLISIDAPEMPLFEGYQFTVNRTLAANGNSILECSGGGWNWRKICEVPMHMDQNQMALKIPLQALCLDADNMNFSFKWIDSMDLQADMLQLYTHGDTAPNGRFAYLYH